MFRCGESMAEPSVNRLLAPPINAQHEVGQAASTDFQVFDMTLPGIELALLALAARVQPTVPGRR